MKHVSVAATFVENKGQWDPRVKFQLVSGGKTLWLTDTGIVFDNVRSKAEHARVDGHAALQGPRIPPSLPDQSAGGSYERLVFCEDFIGAIGTPTVVPINVQPGEYNYMTGSDPKGWHTGLHGYAGVIYSNVWPGIDVKLTRNGADIEQEFLVHPGADLTRVQIAYRGIDGMSAAKDGSLEINTAFGKLRETPPHIYQEIAGRRIKLAGRFKLLGETSYTFDVAAHKAEYAMVVDPTLLYSTFLGGSAGNDPYNRNDEVATGIAVDASGDAYVAGRTTSTDFPITPGAFQTSSAGYAAFVTKLNPAGSALVYSTYLSGISTAVSIALDENRDAYVAGSGVSSGFPTTPNGYSQSCGNSGFLTVLNPSGSGLVYSTCFGGTNPNVGWPSVTSMAVDSKGHAYIAGFGPTGTIPTTANAYQTSPACCSQYAFATVFDPTASGAASLLYSTYFSAVDNLWGSAGNAIAADAYGNFYVTGYAGENLPITPGAFQSSLVVASGVCRNAYGAGLPYCPDGFVAKFNPSASGAQSLIYSTYLGGQSYDSPTAITVDASGNAYVTGFTSSPDFPVTPGAFQTSALVDLGYPTIYVGFITKLNAGGSNLVYSTYLGGTSGLPEVSGQGIALDSQGDAYVTGWTVSSSFPVTSDAYQSTFASVNTDLADAIMTKLNPTGSALIYSSYLGGRGGEAGNSIAVDQTGDTYIAGYTSSADLPITAGAFQTNMHGTGDAFVTKFPIGAPQALGVTGITPAQGGNLGTVRPRIVGGGFHNGAVAQLTGPVTITGSSIEVGSEGQTIDVTFNLSGAPPGNYNVVVTNVDGSSASLGGAFTVTQGGTPQLWVSMAGRQSIHPGVPSQIAVTFGNKGNIDIYDVVLLIHLPTGVQYSVSGLAPFPDPYPGQDQIGFNTSSDIVLPLWIYRIPAGSSGNVFLSITAADGTTTLPLEADLFEAPLTGFALTGDFSSTPFNLDLVAQAIAASIVEYLGLVSSFGSTTSGAVHGPLDPCGPGSADDCEAKYVQAHDAALIALVADVRRDLPTDLVIGYPLELLVDAVAGAVLAQFITVTAAIVIAVGIAALLLYTPALLLYNALGASTRTVDVIGSIDPNEKDGPIGVGTAHYLPGNAPVGYSIFFENEPQATAPAQQVSVTDAIDPYLDAPSIQLTQIILAGQQVVLPAGSGSPLIAGVSTTIDLRPSQNLLAVVTAKFNPASRVLGWTFQSIDPVTGLPPTDPRVGLLAPGAEGSAFFEVNPAGGIPTNTQVQNQATVVFDNNPPVDTGIWMNTVDNASPTTRVAALPPTENTASFKVQWSGTDQGSGIQDYTIYASDNGGPFTAFLVNTAAMSTSFTGQDGHTYGFYSIARDLVGNIENPKTAAEATTQATQGAAPSFKLSPASLAFGSVVVGSTSGLKTVKLTHRGPTVPLLTISSITTSGDYFQTNDCPGTLDAGTSCTLTVAFTPNIAGVLNGALSVYDSFGNSPQVASLSGTGLAAVSAAPTSLTFSSPVGSTSAPGTLTVTNSTAADVSLSYSASATFSAAPGSPNGCGSTVSANSNCEIAVTFAPEQPGTIYGSLIVTGAFPTQVVDLTGTATGGTGSTLTFSPAKLTFKTPQAIGTTSAPLTVTMTNKGTSAVDISGLSGSSGFTATPSGTKPCGSSLVAKAKCTFQVAFTPQVTGPTEGSISVANSGPISPVLYDVSGTGVNVVSFSPASLTFAAQAVGTTSDPQSVTLFNNQSVSLNVSSIVVSGDYSAVPGGTNPCSSAVAVNSSCTFVVSITPTKKGAIKGAVTITDDAPTSPQVFPLTGKGK